MTQQPTYCCLNGEILPETEAHISVHDLGILRGYGCTEYLRTYQGKPFLLDEHLSRLFISAHAIHLPIPFTKEQITNFIFTLLEKNTFQESHIKIIVTGGVSEDGMGKGASTFYILITPLTPFNTTFYTQGVKVITHEHLREFPQAKATNYMTAIALRQENKMRNIFEIIYTFQGQVLEASTSNIFFFFGNTLVTPKDLILKGVTRNTIIELVKPHWNVEERQVDIEELSQADEMFITGSYKEVMPVIALNGNSIGTGRVGKRTKKVIQEYQTYINQWINNH